MADYSDWEIVGTPSQDYSDWEIVEPAKSSSQSKVPGSKKKDFISRTDRTGLLGVAKDVGEGVVDTVSGIPSALHGIAKGLGQTAAQGITDPLRLAQNSLGGWATFGQRALNLPNSANQYLQSRDLIKPEGETAQLLEALTIPNSPRQWEEGDNEFTKILKSIHLPKVGAYDYAQAFGKKAPKFKEEQEADEFVKEAIPTTIFSTLSGRAGRNLGKAGGLSGKSISSLETLGGSAGLSTNEFGAERNPYGMLALPAIGKGAKAAIEFIPNVAKSLNQGKGIKKNILSNQKELFNVEQNAGIAQEAISGLMGEHLNEPIGHVKLNAATTIGDVGKQLHKAASKLYDDFRDTHGKSPIKGDRITNQSLQESHNIYPRDLSQTSRKMIEKANSSSNVQSYIDLAKQLRDEASHLRKSAVMEKQYGNKQKMIRRAERIEKLKNGIDSKIESSLSPEGALQHQAANQFYKDYVVPFLTDNTLKGTRSNRPHMPKSNILGHLDKEGYHALKEVLLDNPETASAIGKHDLRSIKLNKIESIKNAIEGDLGRTLTPELKAGLEKHYNTLLDSNKTIQAIKTKLKKDGLTQAEIDQKIAPYIEAIKKLPKGAGMLYGLKFLVGM